MRYVYLNVHVQHGALRRIRGQHQAMRHFSGFRRAFDCGHGVLSRIEAMAKRVMASVELCQARGRVRKCGEQIAPKTTKPHAGIFDEGIFANEHGTRHPIEPFVEGYVDLQYQCEFPKSENYSLTIEFVSLGIERRLE